MRILFLNQYFPPDPAPTGLLFGEIADALRAHGHEVDFIDAGLEYRSGQGKGGRMKRELMALVRMLWRGLLARRPDVVISGSSPPCLLVAAQAITMRHGARSLHWCMDLYPEIAVALGEVKEGALVRLIRTFMGWAYRRCSTVVALDDDMATLLSRYGANCINLRPWVTNGASTDSTSAPSPHWTWLYSGNLGRAHEWETLLRAQALIEARGRGISLVFQGGGPSWVAAKAKSESMGLKNIEWRGYAAVEDLRGSLLAADCLVVTERPEVKGMLWPSKLALMLALPRPIVFVGPVDGAIAQSLHSYPHAAVFSPGDAEGLAAWLCEAQETRSSVAAGDVLDAEVHRAESLSRWVELIESEAKRPSRTAREQVYDR